MVYEAFDCEDLYRFMVSEIASERWRHEVEIMEILPVEAGVKYLPVIKINDKSPE
jgi:hypothetical protein